MTDTAFLLMGPTASGKTDIAIELCKRFPCDIISVDSALVYRGMDIGTAKPDAETLQSAPHQLVDIRDPEESYSAGEFVRDAESAIRKSFANDRIPLLAGGTMMYFRALTEGIADLPAADETARAAIDAEAAKLGWPSMHAQLETVDPDTAARLDPNDKQRIQRALEVYRVSGKPISEWHTNAASESKRDYSFAKIGLNIEPRALLHERIAERLDLMIAAGFEQEMRTLRARPGLSGDSTAMRSVGYRQFWRYLDGDYDAAEARDRALFATRQLAKRQITWLRSEKDVFLINPLEGNAIATITPYLIDFLNA
ncbi:MAG: tRNA (adenosine(37)-N6)-dimethylallyltransferase MiaA [Pseudomonadota bacterium]